MIDNPFIDFKNLNENELLEKESSIRKNLAKAYYAGVTADIISQLEWFLEMIEQEKEERLYRENFDMIQKMFPEIIETDPIDDSLKTDIDPLLDPVKTTIIEKPSADRSTLPEPVFHKEYIKKK